MCISEHRKALSCCSLEPLNRMNYVLAVGSRLTEAFPGYASTTSEYLIVDMGPKQSLLVTPQRPSKPWKHYSPASSPLWWHPLFASSLLYLSAYFYPNCIILRTYHLPVVLRILKQWWHEIAPGLRISWSVLRLLTRLNIHSNQQIVGVPIPFVEVFVFHQSTALCLENSKMDEHGLYNCERMSGIDHSPNLYTQRYPHKVNASTLTTADHHLTSNSTNNKAYTPSANATKSAY
jgi:hypothetical protein